MILQTSIQTILGVLEIQGPYSEWWLLPRRLREPLEELSLIGASPKLIQLIKEAYLAKIKWEREHHKVYMENGEKEILYPPHILRNLTNAKPSKKLLRLLEKAIEYELKNNLSVDYLIFGVGELTVAIEQSKVLNDRIGHSELIKSLEDAISYHKKINYSIGSLPLEFARLVQALSNSALASEQFKLFNEAIEHHKNNSWGISNLVGSFAYFVSELNLSNTSFEEEEWESYKQDFSQIKEANQRIDFFTKELADYIKVNRVIAAKGKFRKEVQCLEYL